MNKKTRERVSRAGGKAIAAQKGLDYMRAIAARGGAKNKGKKVGKIKQAK